MTSEWERNERKARVDHITRLFMRGASGPAIREAIPDATDRDMQAAYKRYERSMKG